MARARDGGHGRLVGQRLACRLLFGRRVGRGERVGDGTVVRSVAVVDAERAERVDERLLRRGEGHAVLRPARAGERRLDVAEIELDDVRVGRMVRRVVPEQVLLAVRLDERDALRAAPGQREVVERDLVDREEAARRSVLGRHVPERRPVCERQGGNPLPEVLDELPDDARLAQDLGHRQHQVGRGRSLGERAAELEADDLRHEHGERLAEHRGLRLDAARAPAEDTEAVHHRCVRVGPDERVGERDAVAILDHACEVLEVDLVADPRSGRHDLQARERLLAPAQEEVALVVALELELDVAPERRPRSERVHLDRVVDHELGRDERIDLRRIAAEIGHCIPHRGEVDDCGHARQVLQQDARGRERDLAGRLGFRVPPRNRLDVCLAAVAQHVLEQHAQRVGQARDVVRGLQRIEPKDLVGTVSDLQLGRRGHCPD